MNRLLHIVVFAALLTGGVLPARTLRTQEAAPSAQNPQQAPSRESPSVPAEGQEPPSQPPAANAQPEQPTQAPPSQASPPTEAQPKNPEPKRTTESGVPQPPVLKRKKKTAKSQADNSKVVVRNGGAKDNSPQLSPGMTSEQALHSRENTSQLLSTTELNLKKIAGHQLSPAQKSMLDQIHSYLRDSKAASASGDLTRAHTLAFKAHLLSDDLANK